MFLGNSTLCLCSQRVTTCGPACGTGVAGAVGAARRLASSFQSTSTGSLPDYGTQIIDPYRLLEDDLNGIYEDIRAVSSIYIVFLYECCGFVEWTVSKMILV
jgi:hypothetical protein